MASTSASPRRLTPTFYCPIAPRTHPRAAALDAVAREWLLRRELESDPEQVLRLMRTDFGTLTARTLPLGRFEPLQTMARLYITLFAFDDALCDETRASARQLVPETSWIVRVLETPGATWPGASRYAAALRELQRELAHHATARQVRRWTAAMRLYLTGLVWEAVHREARTLPGLDDYVTLWMHSVGAAPLTAMVEIVMGSEVPERELESTGARALTEVTWCLIGWDNDLWSRAKELSRAGDPLNLVDVLAAQRDCSIERAHGAALAMRDRLMVLFLRLREQLMQGASPAFQQYLTGLGHVVRGHLDWAAGCARYQVAGGERQGVTRPAWWRSEPVDASLRPLPIPSLAWWWEQLDT